MAIVPRCVDKPLVLYGYGKLGQLAEEIFDELNISILNVIDKSNYLVEPPNPDILLAICVATEPYTRVTAPLKAAGWTDIVPVWDIIEAYPEVGIHNGFFAGECTEEEWRNREFVQSRLADELSWYSYNHFLNWRLFRKECYMEYIQVIPRESLPSTLADIRLRQHVQKYLIGIQGDVILHNEGHELQSLQENIAIFNDYRPRLHVACYHSRDGLWEIEKFCMENLPDYVWTFRLHAYQGQAAFLYGTPKEKI